MAVSLPNQHVEPEAGPAERPDGTFQSEPGIQEPLPHQAGDQPRRRQRQQIDELQAVGRSAAKPVEPDGEKDTHHESDPDMQDAEDRQVGKASSKSGVVRQRGIIAETSKHVAREKSRSGQRDGDRPRNETIKGDAKN